MGYKARNRGSRLLLAGKDLAQAEFAAVLERAKAEEAHAHHDGDDGTDSQDANADGGVCRTEVANRIAQHEWDGRGEWEVGDDLAW